MSNIECMEAYIQGMCDERAKLILVINDIKAEIKELPYQRIFGNVSSYSLLDTVLEIIDKHMEGREDK